MRLKQKVLKASRAEKIERRLIKKLIIQANILPFTSDGNIYILEHL